ncbi:armadillo-type protein [Crucibulum laeve]|uniref:Armadillo-type protein n=1 Tax=Crucibulum laeve TaxID=68775 RepID=A0A5C3M8K6_9AGAR|nr:armadillo-type protein [Crucibulum laeve]
MVYNQPELLAEHMLPEVPSLLEIVKTSKTPEEDAVHSNILAVICQLSTTSENARKRMIPEIPRLVPYLKNGAVIHRQSVLDMLEGIAEGEEDARDGIVQAMKHSLFASATPLTPEETESVIASFENNILYMREHGRRLFIQAGAVDVMFGGINSPRKETRLAAQSCIAQIFPTVDEIEAELPEKAEDAPTLTSRIMSAFMKGLRDEDDAIVTAAAEFFSSTDSEDASAVFTQDPEAMVALVMLLARKEPGTIGASYEWALVRLAEGDGLKAVAEGFRIVWVDKRVPEETKVKIVGGLVDSFVNVRKAAMIGGLGERLLEWLEDEKHRTSTLTILDKLMDTEQIVGHYLLKLDIVPPLLSAFEGPSSEDRCAAAKVMARLLDAFSDDEEAVSQRNVAVAVLTDPNVLPRILAQMYATDLKTAGAAAKLVGEIVFEEDGTEAWSYDPAEGKPPPPSPLKDSIITPELVNHLMGLLKQKDSASGALYLLAQACWGNTRGFNIVCKEFEAHISTADGMFFASLSGEYVGRHLVRQERRVADAAVKAGALDRAQELLGLEYDNIEMRRAVVEGFRVLLCSDDVDRNLGRNNKSLPRALAALIADETQMSLNDVYWVLAMLEDIESTEWLKSWSEFVSPASVEHILKAFHSIPVELEEPSADGLAEDKYEKIIAEHQQKAQKAREDLEKITSSTIGILRLSLPLWVPYASQLIGPLLVRCHEISRDGDTLTVVSKLAVETNNVDSIAVSIKELLSRNPALSVSRCDDWIRASPVIATAMCKAGIVEGLLHTLQATEEDESYGERGMALYALAGLVRTLDDEDLVKGAKDAFFTDQKALAGAITLLDTEYEAARAANDLATLSKDFPQGITTLEEASILPTLFKLFDSTDGTSDESAPLLGLLCHQDPVKLTNLLRSYISALTSPPADAVLSDKGGKKKKKKAYTPRISERSVWERFTLLSASTLAARKAVVNAGAIQDASRLIKSTDKKKVEIPLEALRQLVEADEEYAEAVSKILPRCAELLSTNEPSTAILRLVRAFLPQHVAYVISAGLHQPLLKIFGESASAFDDMSELIDTIHTLAGLDDSRQPLVQAMQEILALEEVVDFENNWGYSHAFRRLVIAGDVGATFAVDTGAIDYAMRLLKSDNIHMNVKGGALAATLSRCKTIQARSVLLENGITALIENGRAKAIALANKPFFEAEDVDNEEAKTEHRTECQRYSEYSVKLATFNTIIENGKEEYEEDYYL